jgi:hypothetical protein
MSEKKSSEPGEAAQTAPGNAPQSPGAVKKAVTTIAKPKITPKAQAAPISRPVENPVENPPGKSAGKSEPEKPADDNPFSIFGWGE